MTQFVFNVWFSDARECDEPTLFERREDAEEYAGIWESGEVEEVTVMDEGLAEAEALLAEARSGLEAISARQLVERNPDGDDQAAATMRLIARETLNKLDSTPTAEQGEKTTPPPEDQRLRELLVWVEEEAREEACRRAGAESEEVDLGDRHGGAHDALRQVASRIRDLLPESKAGR